MNITPIAQPGRLRLIIAAVIVAIASLVIPLSQSASAGTAEAASVSAGPKPTIVLVHGRGPTPAAGTASSSACRLTVTPCTRRRTRSRAWPTTRLTWRTPAHHLRSHRARRALLRRGRHHQRRRRRPAGQSPRLRRRLRTRAGPDPRATARRLSRVVRRAREPERGPVPWRPTALVTPTSSRACSPAAWPTVCPPREAHVLAVTQLPIVNDRADPADRCPGVEDHTVMGRGGHRRPRHPAGVAASHGPHGARPYHRGRRAAPP